MRYWNTGDDATDSNLGYLESLGQVWDGMTVEHFMDKLRGVIGVEKMLPAAVRQHFSFPYLFIGAAAYSWSKERLRDETAKLCGAINEGLDRVAADASLSRGGGADFSDRPHTVGERVLEALEFFKKHRGSAELSQLRAAIGSAQLHSQMTRLDQALTWKRARGSVSPEQEILRAIGDLEWHASRYHHERG
jgi:hypothetical protein